MSYQLLYTPRMKSLLQAVDGLTDEEILEVAADLERKAAILRYLVYCDEPAQPTLEHPQQKQNRLWAN